MTVPSSDLSPLGYMDSSGSGFPPEETLHNCSLLGFCISESLNSSSISCRNVWEVSFQIQKYAPYVAAIQAAFFIISFCWNLIIIVNFIRRTKILKDSACVYLLNVTIINFLFSIFVEFQCLLNESGRSFFLGNTDIHRCRVCELLGFIVMFLTTNSLHTLAVLSFDRFILFMKPMKYYKYGTWKSAFLVVLVIWVWCICLSIPPYFGFGQYSFNTVIANCHPQWSGNSVRGIPNLNYIALIAIESLIPITLLIVTNVWSIRIILKSIKKKHERWLTNVSSSLKELEEVGNKIKLANSRKQWHLVKVYGAIFVAHVLCWTPVLSVLIAAAVLGASSIPAEVFLLSWLFYLTIPVVHPMTETYFIKDIRISIAVVKQQFRRSLASHTHLSKPIRRNWRRHSISFVEPKTSSHSQERNGQIKRAHSFTDATSLAYSGTSSNVTSEQVNGLTLLTDSPSHVPRAPLTIVNDSCM